jgi:hypothetical protein
MKTAIPYHDLRGLAIGTARLLELHRVEYQVGANPLQYHPQAAAAAREAVREPMLAVSSPALEQLDACNGNLTASKTELAEVAQALSELEREGWLAKFTVKDRVERKMLARHKHEELKERIADLEIERKRLEPTARADLDAAAEVLGQKLGQNLREREEKWIKGFIEALQEHLSEIFEQKEESRAIGRAVEVAIRDRLEGKVAKQ